jgi:hypothetical protein
MDDIVKAALLKWPNVPQCYGWLALDARGDWYLRDERAQATAAFPQLKGSRIEHAGLRDFIARNYEADARGAWFFQNGPQRVYVELEAAPWVWRLESRADGRDCRISTHTGQDTEFHSAWLDEHDRLYFDTPLGFGLVHSLDTGLAAPAIEAGMCAPPQTMRFADMPVRFGFVRTPRPTSNGAVG